MGNEVNNINISIINFDSPDELTFDGGLDGNYGFRKGENPERGCGCQNNRGGVEAQEANEMPTTLLDKMVDMFGIDDTQIYGENGKIVVDTGFGSDKVNVTKAKDGGVNVEVNGKIRHFTPEQAKNLEIRTGSGDDKVNIADNVKTGITVRGGSGNDTIKGGGGNDRIYGGSGNDKLKGGKGDDYIHGGSGRDKIKGGRGNDTLHGGTGNDKIKGGRGSDNIYGGDGNDKIKGGRGDDFISGGLGSDKIKGGSGDDFIRDQFPEFRLPQFRPAPLFPPLNEPPFPPFNENAPVDFKPPINRTDDPQPEIVPYHSRPTPFNRESLNEAFEKKTGLSDKMTDALGINDNKVTVNQDGGIVLDTGSGSDKINVTQNPRSGVVTVNVNGKNYRFSAEQAKNLTINGGSGNDNITIAPGVRAPGLTVNGGSGNDRIVAGHSNDQTRGGTGFNLNGGSGNDVIIGSNRKDNISGGSGNDYLQGGGGDDTVSGGSGRDMVRGGKGSDALDGGDGRDTVMTDNRDSTATGGAGRDRMRNEDRESLQYRIAQNRFYRG